MLRKIKENKIVLSIIFLSVLIILLLKKWGYQSYSRYVTDNLHYDQGIVVEISDENIEYDDNLKLYLGTQNLKVRMTEGSKKDTYIEVTNYLTKTHNVYAKENMSLIIEVDTPENLEPYYTVYNYDRRFSMTSCIALLIAAIVCIGGKKGVRSLLGLIYSMYIVIEFLLPAIFSGGSPILLSVVTSILSTTVTLLLLNGESKKTLAAILSTSIGTLFSLLLFTIMSYLIHLDGFSSSEAEGLLLINEATAMQIKDVLFAGVLISSLGAIMDVGMSIVSSLYEVYAHNPSLNARELFNSGIEIGKDMIGTMTNTLILAFTGSALLTLLVFLSYQVQFNQLMNSNYINIELAQGICGTLGIVLTIPIASGITALILGKSEKNK